MLKGHNLRGAENPWSAELCQGEVENVKHDLFFCLLIDTVGVISIIFLHFKIQNPTAERLFTRDKCIPDSAIGILAVAEKGLIAYCPP